MSRIARLIPRRDFRRSRALLLVVAAAAIPRLIVVALERNAILEEFVEKSDRFATTLVADGTFGFVPGVPSAHTQPLYGWFLAALYWVFERHWLVVGLAQVLVAVAIAIVVYETGRRFVNGRVGLLAALLATVHPYLVWHDVHVNREILDQLAAAAVFVLCLIAAERRTAWTAAALGAALGVAVLGNSRLALLPFAVAGYLLWRQFGAARTALTLAGCALVITPWVVRNRSEVGCATITTDARALWKANNPNTWETLRSGKWIDEVPPLPGAPALTPEFTGDIFDQTGEIVDVDECAQMRLYQDEVLRFWRDEPGEKAKLAAQATWMLWDPRPTRTESGPASGRSFARDLPETLYALVLFALALLGTRAVSRSFLVLCIVFVGYQTFAAMIFVGATRYRVPFDFVLALLAAAAVDRWLARREPADEIAAS